jgi:hypothetical protein
MSILDPVPRELLGTTFTHYGWFAGLCPVYVGRPYSAGPDVAARNWVPEWWFDLVEALFGAFCWTASHLNPDFEPGFPIFITGEIQRPTEGSS